jgi:periplasmic divalent cation tolerance protein
MSAYRLMIATAPEEKAEALARALVEEKLAACVNILQGARSIYAWKGALCDERESLLLIKTTKERALALAERFAALHPYETPELLSLEIREPESNLDYLSWVAASVEK